MTPTIKISTLIFIYDFPQIHYLFFFQSAVALFDMIEFYESCTKLNLAFNKNICTRGWQSCSSMLRKVRLNVMSNEIQYIIILVPEFIQPKIFVLTYV